MLEIHVFTCAAANYIPKVRMLFESLRQFHPEWRLHLALADDLTEDLDLAEQDKIVSSPNNVLLRVQ